MPGVFLAIAYAALLLFLMRRLPFFTRVPGLSMRSIAALFGLKILAGTALWAVYTYAYPDRSTADIFKYFDDSKVLYDALWTAPGDFLRMLTGIGNDSPYFDQQYYGVMNNWVRRFENNVYNDSHTMIRFNAVVRIFSFGYYHVHTVFACFLSTVGIVALFRALQPLVRGLERLLAVSLFLWPSVLFWASGVLKESLLMLGLGLFLLGTIGVWPTRLAWRPLLAALIGLALMLVVKFYVLLCLLPGLLAWIWVRERPGRVLLKFVVVHAVLFAAAMMLGEVWPERNVLYMLAMKQSDFIGMATEVNSGSLLPVPDLEPTMLSFLQNVPSALYMAFASPFTSINKGMLGIMGGAENLLVFLLPIVALWRTRPWKDIDGATVLFLASYVLLLALLIGWTVPVVGALVRYRVPMLPFLSVIALLVIDPKKLPRWLPSPLTS